MRLFDLSLFRFCAIFIYVIVIFGCFSDVLASLSAVLFMEQHCSNVSGRVACHDENADYRSKLINSHRNDC